MEGPVELASRGTVVAKWYARPAAHVRALACHLLPESAFTRRVGRLLPRDLSAVPQAVLERVDYCNRLEGPGHALPLRRLADYAVLGAGKSMPRGDLVRLAKGFGLDVRLNALLNDVLLVPEAPTLVKSRPIGEGNANSVLLPLDRLRHFDFIEDRRPWSAKRPVAVWRGRISMVSHQQARIAALTRYNDDPRHDIGHVKSFDGLPPPKPWMTREAQLEHRYILALEGNDVATSLKWIMGSNSVALSPALEYETWYMEGRLVPGVHFIGLKPDLSDLDEKIAWAEANPGAVARIIRAAQDWAAMFRDSRQEAFVAALVLQKYIERTGGLSHSRIRRELFGPGAAGRQMQALASGAGSL